MGSILCTRPEVARGKLVSVDVVGNNGFNTCKGRAGVKPKLKNLRIVWLNSYIFKLFIQCFQNVNNHSSNYYLI